MRVDEKGAQIEPVVLAPDCNVVRFVGERRIIGGRGDDPDVEIAVRSVADGARAAHGINGGDGAIGGCGVQPRGERIECSPCGRIEQCTQALNARGIEGAETALG